MKSVPRLVRRFVGILLLSFLLLAALNITLLVIYTTSQMPNAYPWKTAKEVADDLSQNEDGYQLSEKMARELEASNAWAIFIENDTMQVVWQTDGLPETIPTSYSISDVASLTRGYIDDYPTFTGEAKNGLVVLGYPKDSFWKHMWPSWDYQLIANLPKTALSVLIINVTLIFLIYMIANSKLLKSVKPIVDGIQALPAEQSVHIPEKGILCELAASLNKTSEILQFQNRQLCKKENARANWIAGVSHDIRTPLSMVMGYASQLMEDTRLNDAQRKKAAVIVKQSERMRNLINDLNLASKLEYNMQPIHPQTINMVSIVRQVAVDFINLDIEGSHLIEWETSETLTSCLVHADKDLIKRAVGNLIQNCITHNEQGCTIHVGVTKKGDKCTVSVVDDGVGATDEQIERLNKSPHYMACDENTSEQRHGLGLLIVRQIAAAHGGTVTIGHGMHGGFSVKFTLHARDGTG